MTPRNSGPRTARSSAPTARQLPRLIALVASGALGLGLLGVPATATAAGEQVVTYGDVTRDGLPDILLPDGAGDLRAVQDATGTVDTGQLVSYAASSPTGTWQDVQFTHRGTLRGGIYFDELITHIAGGQQRTSTRTRPPASPPAPRSTSTAAPSRARSPASTASAAPSPARPSSAPTGATPPRSSPSAPSATRPPAPRPEPTSSR
ncbi:hypothetical protein ACFQ2M_33300 [Kitasatospora saccharophila]|uniref:hypothetical protein n=1 Tax=Kitasatospora saccharophila TaxID=407973 RepID=UPI00362970AB